MLIRHVLSSLLIFSCLGLLRATLVQTPSYGCFGDNVTFVCTHPSRLESNTFVNIIITILHRPGIEPSRLISTSPSTDAVSGFMSQNLTLIALNPSEASALVLCLSVLWSNISNSSVTTQVQSNNPITLASVPPPISSLAIRVLSESSMTLLTKHNTVVFRGDVLLYSIAISTGIRREVSYDDLAMEIFNVGNIFDACFMLSVNSTNCMGRGEDFSTHFILPRVTNGSLIRLSQTEFCWNYPGNLSSVCPEPYRVDLLQNNVFTFSLINNNMIIANLTDVTLSLPHQYCFKIPEEHLDTENLFIRIYINGFVSLTATDVLIPSNAVFPTVHTASNLVRIIIIVVPSVVAGILIVSFFMAVLILLCCLFRRKSA